MDCLVGNVLDATSTSSGYSILLFVVCSLSKDHKGVFWSMRGKIGSTKDMNVFIQLILIRTSQNTMGGLRSKDLRQWSTSIILPGPETTLEAPPSQDATG